jgi:uncharacterized NAD(P)/FAD-binding protein YdhS
MGAFADNEGHFWQWLQKNMSILGIGSAGGINADSFVPRGIYGRYLQGILGDARATHSNLSVLPDTILDIEKNGHFVVSGSGEIYHAKYVVLALGTFLPGGSRPNAPSENPYAPHVLQRLAEPGDVLILGTGLTSLDMVMTIARKKKTGRIHLLSRRGLLPGVHIMPEKYPAFIDRKDLPSTTSQLYRVVRAEVKEAARQGIGWQNVLDAIRPVTQRLWQTLDENEQRRFLRCLSVYWDVHRHRCAPEVLAVCERLRANGRLIVHRGHIVSKVSGVDTIRVAWRPRGKRVQEEFEVCQIVNCTGPQLDCRKLDDILVRNLLARGLIIPDRLHIGLVTTSNYLVLNTNNQPTQGLYALGSLLKGRLYESVAVPELRLQTADIANIIGACVERPPPLVFP